MITSLITVDLQYDFFDRLAHQDAGRLVKAVCLPAVRKLIRHARDNKWNIVHLISEHSGPQTLPPHLQRRGVKPYCLENSEGAEIVDGLCQPGDVVVKKHSFDGFPNTNLVNVLRGSDVIVVSGVAADCCILFTANSAVNVHGKQVYLPFQAIAASTPQDYVFGLRAAAKSVGDVIDLDDLLRTSGAAPSLEAVEGLDYENIEAKIGPWFNEQLRRVAEFRGEADPVETPVRQLLKKLEEKLASGTGPV